MVPGHFELPRPTGEYDTFVSSGFFPLDPGDRQRMAIAVAIAGGGQTLNDDISSVTDKLTEARTAYEADYQFAKAPTQVTLTAVPGDGKVTLYWDDIAEYSIDSYIENIGGPSRDFEGYRVYRSTDASFSDAKVITDGSGTLTLYKPIAQFDLKDGFTGYDPVGYNGVMFYLGDDTGLRHSYTDTDVTNGQRYFYAVTAYDFGYAAVGIAPSETPISVDVDLQGNIKTGPNVAVVRPSAEAAGYLPAEIESFEHVSGSSTSEITIAIVDPDAVQDGHLYEITFEDTLISGEKNDTLTTKNFTITDVTSDAVVIDKSTNFSTGDEIPIFDGIRLEMVNEEAVSLNEATSGWNRAGLFPYVFSKVAFIGIEGQSYPNDYRVVIGEAGYNTSKDTSIGFYPLPAQSVNFKVYNITTRQEVEFAFAELDGNDGCFSIDTTDGDNTDIIMLLEKGNSGKLVYTWQIYMNLTDTGENPRNGDTLNIYLKKPFLSTDKYQFKIKGSAISKLTAKQELANIRVVPNPYIVTASWENKNTYRSGRGPREIHFINLPTKCTIRIFDVYGTLVDKLEHEAVNENGTEIWDVLNKESLDISYGIYIYHINTPGIGEKTGTFSIIK